MRCRRRDRNVRRGIKTRHIRDLNINLSKLYESKLRSNNTLMELNVIQYKQHKDHCIHLSKIKLVGNKSSIFYDRVRYGKFISTTKENLKSSGNKKSKYINMMKSKKKLVLFTANKNECIKHFPNTVTVGTMMTYNSKDENEIHPSMSGVVILMMATIRDNKDESL